MDGFSGGVAVWQAAEAAIKLGEKLVEKYRAFKHANGRITDLVLRVEGIWVKTDQQINIVRRLSNSTAPRLQVFHEECFSRLKTKLDTALIKISDVGQVDLSTGIDLETLSIAAKTSRRLKYAVLEKHLEQLVDDLENWHTIFDPSWYLIARVQDTVVDTTLSDASTITTLPAVTVIKQIRSSIQSREHIKGPSASIFVGRDIVKADRSRLHPTNLDLAQLALNDQDVLIDTTTYPPGTNQSQVIDAVRNLARLLSTSTAPTLSLLQCLGVIKPDASDQSPASYQYCFALPPHQGLPIPLRMALSRPAPSLDTKMSLAKSLAKAITSLHAANFVHKNIRPEVIVTFEDTYGEYSRPYLVGFECIRSSQAHSRLVSDQAWERNLYRHPSRQGLQPQEYYQMQHDIYSLGVCLLEIGLWQCFVEYSNSGDPVPTLPISKSLQKENKGRAANEIKAFLTNLAREQLPSKMGRTYTEVVVSSLTSHDKDPNNIFANAADLYDEDGVAIGVAFIENILMRLEGILL